jgi:hypothetical protein
MFHNIERSYFHSGEYVGHACGPWRIVRSNGRRGPWLAVHGLDCRIPPIYARTLRDVSDRLAAYVASLSIATKH